MTKQIITGDQVWRLGERGGYRDINLYSYVGRIYDFVNDRLLVVQWEHPNTIRGVEYISNLEKRG
jgi:hypothetical protein